MGWIIYEWELGMWMWLLLGRPYRRVYSICTKVMAVFVVRDFTKGVRNRPKASSQIYSPGTNPDQNQTTRHVFYFILLSASRIEPRRTSTTYNSYGSYSYESSWWFAWAVAWHSWKKWGKVNNRNMLGIYEDTNIF